MTSKSLTEQLRATDKDSFETEAVRNEVIAAAKTLLVRIEKPFEQLRDIVLTDPIRGACPKVCHDLELFTSWKAEGEIAMTVSQLASLVRTDEALLRTVSFQRPL